MPPKGKPKNAANQHDKRHEGGLALPGKRVARQRSNGQLNNQPNGSASSGVVAAQPSTGLTNVNRGHRSLADAVDPLDSSGTSARDHDITVERLEREGTQTDGFLVESDQQCEMADRAGHSDGNGGSAARNGEGPRPDCPPSRQSYPGTSSSGFSTILVSYPLRDAISILILLLSLPPTLILIIQTLFASLTFVPPTAGLSLPNVKEIFGSSGMGYPALATMVIVDLLFWICWLPMWTPLQDMFLDLSHAVIAVSLSGAAASSGGPTYSIASTSIIVCVVHVLRYKAIHLTALDYLRSVINRASIGAPIDVFSFAAQYSSPIAERSWLFTAARALLCIHIVSQGVTTYIRRSLVKANEQQNANVPTIVRTDTEAAAGTEQAPRTSISAGEANHNALNVPGAETRSTAAASGLRDARSRENSGRRRRKQANLVRSQQPLWAAVASTKITCIKEKEQREAAADAREAANTDALHDSLTTSTRAVTNRIWVRDVRDAEILFTVEISPDSTKVKASRDKEHTSASANIDKSKPFYVCINGATWSSTRIAPSLVRGSGSDVVDRYDGEIFGLAPLSSYFCEVISTANRNVLCETSIITQAAPSAEQAAVTSTQPPPTLRPSSPISTLKQSIQAAEAKLLETRNRGKKSKRDQRAVNSDIKREINILRSKLESSGGTDDKQERRLNQIMQHKNQAEDAAAEIKEQIEALGETPQQEIDESEIRRRVWKSAFSEKTNVQREYDEAKAEADRELISLKLDLDQALSRREKLQARHTARTQDVQKLVSKKHADMTARQRRDFERAQVSQARENEEQQLRFHINSFETETQNFQQKAHDAYQQIAALQSWTSQQQPPPYPGYSSPPTPETQIAGLNGAVSGVSGVIPFPSFNTQLFSGASFKGPVFSIGQPQATAPRARSSSMLSQYSGFTENGDEGPSVETMTRQTWPMHAANNFSGASIPMPDERHHSDGSASGTGSLTGGSTGSNSPRPDAKPFIPTAAAKVVLPIGPPTGAVHARNSPRDKEKSRPSQSPLQTSATVGTVDRS